MKRIFTPLVIAGLMLTGSYAFAGDEVSQAGMAQQNKMMKDCLAKHESSNTKMTKDDIEKACREEIESHKDSSSMVSSDTSQK